jgi:2-polyprenyl-3-methyl-5-hydroxy-6-metoxy-1,4-benzoquinol methylase
MQTTNDIKSNNLKAYENIGLEYENFIQRTEWNIVRPSLTNLLVNLVERNTNNALDLGCNVGKESIRLQCDFGFDVEAVDFSANNIKLAKQQKDLDEDSYDFIGFPNFKVGDIETYIPEKDNYELIQMMFVLFHIDRQKHFNIIDKYLNLLDKGGKFMLTTSMEVGDTVETEFTQLPNWLGKGTTEYSYFNKNVYLERYKNNIVMEFGVNVAEDGIMYKFNHLILGK